MLMTNFLVKNSDIEWIPTSIRPHKPTIKDILHPDIRVLCGTHKMYDVTY